MGGFPVLVEETLDEDNYAPEGVNAPEGGKTPILVISQGSAQLMTKTWMTLRLRMKTGYS